MRYDLLMLERNLMQIVTLLILFAIFLLNTEIFRLKTFLPGSFVYMEMQLTIFFTSEFFTSFFEYT